MVARARQPHAAAAPAKHQQQQQQQQQQDSHMLDKTRLCRFWSKGGCSRGRACTFAHGEVELQPQPDLYRTGLCFDFMKTGHCRAGACCKFAHSQDELRPAVGAQQGPRAGAPAGGAAVAREIREVQRQAVQLQAQLKALQQLAASCPRERRQRPRATRQGRAGTVAALVHKSPVHPAHDPDASTDDEEHSHSNPLSRQFSQQASEGADEWEAGSAGRAADTESSSGSPGGFAVPPLPERFVMVVKNTFVEVALREDEAPIRARSAPPGGRRH